MANDRVAENEGVFGAAAEQYDKLQRALRDNGQLSTDAIIQTGITAGLALEIGPGPGYLGLEWLKKTEGTKLKAVEISPDMIKLAIKNAAAYHVSGRVDYILGKGQELPFMDNTFDAAFTNGSFHEWSDPVKVLSEIYRVLKPGGRFFVSDLRRDVEDVERLKKMVPPERHSGLLSSINASYTTSEAEEIFGQTQFHDVNFAKNMFSLEISGVK